MGARRTYEERAVHVELLRDYDELVGVQIIQRGKRLAKLIDLRPFLRVDGDDVDIDVRGIEKALPKLLGDVLAPGESIMFKHPGGEPDELKWGWNDQAVGDPAPKDFPRLA